MLITCPEFGAAPLRTKIVCSNCKRDVEPINGKKLLFALAVFGALVFLLGFSAGLAKVR